MGSIEVGSRAAAPAGFGHHQWGIRQQMLVFFASLIPIITVFWYSFDERVSLDEAWFKKDALDLGRGGHGPFQRVLATENHLGYGSAFWLILSELSPLPQWGQRFVFTLPVLGVMVFLWRRGPARGRFNASALGYWLFALTPVPYWSGKVLSPDMLIVGASAWAVVLLDTRRGAVWSGLLSGLCVGLKLNAVVVVVACGLWLCIATWGSLGRAKWVRNGIVFGLCVLVGFFAVNPFVLVKGFGAFFAHLEMNKNAPKYDLPRWLWAETSLWDGVCSAGLVHWLYGPLGTVLAVAGCAATRRCRMAAWVPLVTTFCLTILLLPRPIFFFGWYWFPWIVVATLIWVPGPAPDLRVLRPGLPLPWVVGWMAALTALALPQIGREIDRHGLGYTKGRDEARLERAIEDLRRSNPVAERALLIDFSPYEPSAADRLPRYAAGLDTWHAMTNLSTVLQEQKSGAIIIVDSRVLDAERVNRRTHTLKYGASVYGIGPPIPMFNGEKFRVHAHGRIPDTTLTYTLVSVIPEPGH